MTRSSRVSLQASLSSNRRGADPFQLNVFVGSNSIGRDVGEKSTGSSLRHPALPEKVLHSAAFDHSSFDVRYHNVRYQPICLDSRSANKELDRVLKICSLMRRLSSNPLPPFGRVSAFRRSHALREITLD
jgi:hypothetical protein